MNIVIDGGKEPGGRGRLKKQEGQEALDGERS